MVQRRVSLRMDVRWQLVGGVHVCESGWDTSRIEPKSNLVDRGDRGGLRVVLAPQGPSPSRAPNVIAEIFHYHGHEIIQGLIGFFGVSQLLEDFSGTSGNTDFMSNPTSNE